ATELNINNEYKSGYWGNITSRECGSVGGQMVKKMIESYENQLATK
ncbi:alpha/beta-type small acid-soluble spore protein, partial [Orenia marismortui]